MIDLLCEGLAAQGIAYERNVPMAKRTTLRVGGPADVLVHIKNTAEAAYVLAEANKMALPVLVIGNGSNLLVRDGGIRGVVLVIGSAMSGVHIEENTVRAEAGAMLRAVARDAQRAGLSGMEPLSGIPGTIGGAAYMNAGAYGTEMEQLITSVTALDYTGAAHTFPRDALTFGYRKSSLMEQALVITSVSLSLNRGNPNDIFARTADYAKQRREKQPITQPSAGSFFKRPANGYAGTLIEQAGLKGASIGGAEVSAKHAGFLVNRGGATARDFLNLSALVQQRVLEMSGIMLEPEVRILGCDSSC